MGLDVRSTSRSEQMTMPNLNVTDAASLNQQFIVFELSIF